MNSVELYPIVGQSHTDWYQTMEIGNCHMLDEGKTVPLYILSPLLSSACYGSELLLRLGLVHTS